MNESTNAKRSAAVVFPTVRSSSLYTHRSVQLSVVR